MGQRRVLCFIKWRRWINKNTRPFPCWPTGSSWESSFLFHIQVSPKILRCCKCNWRKIGIGYRDIGILSSGRFLLRWFELLCWWVWLLMSKDRIQKKGNSKINLEWLFQSIASVSWVVSVIVYGSYELGDCLQLLAATSWTVSNFMNYLSQQKAQS